MNVLLDPNIIYFLFIGGLVMGIIAIFSPGTGFIELGALFAVALAIYGLVNLPVNSWAITIMIAGFIPFIFSGKKEYRKWLIPTSTILVVVGSLFIFRRDGNAAQANLVLIVIIDLIAVTLLWLFAIKGIEAIRIAPSFNLNELVGQETVALTDIFEEGTIHINGEDWTARSKEPIPEGKMVRVFGRNGLVLLVEPAEGNNSADLG
ncbi:MAG: hypothetical protein JEZ00_11075 [Anaerolineaceae bacterium]|nr:hypothetical protein [Anaerolineaceae bacterium]